MASKFMASKLMANAAFEARLLLRPSHQRTVWTVNKLECPSRPALPPILSSRSYSDSTSTPTPPFPESSGSAKGSQSSGPKVKNWFRPKVWVENKLVFAALSAVGGGLVVVCTGFAEHVSESIWGDSHQESRRLEHEAARESAIYDRLKEGPIFQEAVKHAISRTALVEEMRQVITPAEESRPYPLIIGEHGTGKTSLVKLTVKGMDKPKGVVYVDMPRECKSEDDVTKAMKMALGWRPDKVIDPQNPESLEEVLRVLSHHAIKYRQEYKRIPVLIIDNANRLAWKHQELLNHFQDYAKDTADDGIVTVVFVSSEGRVPRHMMERASWSRSGRIIEINDVSKEEALEYLKRREINEEQAAQIHELVGGRMIYLKTIADIIKGGGTLEAMRKTMFSNTKSQLTSAGILPGLGHHEDGAKIVRELLKKGSISEDAYHSLIGYVTGDKLLETNIFAFHYNSREITFQSTLMKRYCEENSALWEGK